MLKLRKRFEDTWDSEPFLARVTYNEATPLPLRSEHLFVSQNANRDLPSGFSAVALPLSARGLVEKPLENVIFLDYDSMALTEGDIVRISPAGGEVRVQFRINSPHNYVLATERCNSYCVMCSQPPRDRDDSYLLEDYIRMLPLLPRSTQQLGITGGEPTLCGDRLLEFIRRAAVYLPETHIHMLTNGRRFSDFRFAEDFCQIRHPDLLLAIPLYSANACIHDYVVQVPGAFEQTVQGLLNLASLGQPIELRMVISKATYQDLEAYADFVCHNLPFVRHVALMGLEIMGFAKMNLDALWIDQTDYQPQLVSCVSRLLSGGVKPLIFNHQLCLLDRSLWQHSVKSISDWKNDYAPACMQCEVREQCGGFFTWNLGRGGEKIRPIRSDDSCHISTV